MLPGRAAWMAALSPPPSSAAEQLVDSVLRGIPASPRVPPHHLLPRQLEGHSREELIGATRRLIRISALTPFLQNRLAHVLEETAARVVHRILVLAACAAADRTDVNMSLRCGVAEKDPVIAQLDARAVAAQSEVCLLVNAFFEEDHSLGACYAFALVAVLLLPIDTDAARVYASAAINRTFHLVHAWQQTDAARPSRETLITVVALRSIAKFALQGLFLIRQHPHDDPQGPHGSQVPNVHGNDASLYDDIAAMADIEPQVVRMIDAERMSQRVLTDMRVALQHQWSQTGSLDVTLLGAHLEPTVAARHHEHFVRAVQQHPLDMAAISALPPEATAGVSVVALLHAGHVFTMLGIFQFATGRELDAMATADLVYMAVIRHLEHDVAFAPQLAEFVLFAVCAFVRDASRLPAARHCADLCQRVMRFSSAYRLGLTFAVLLVEQAEADAARFFATTPLHVHAGQQQGGKGKSPAFTSCFGNEEDGEEDGQPDFSFAIPPSVSATTDDDGGKTATTCSADDNDDDDDDNKNYNNKNYSQEEEEEEESHGFRRLVDSLVGFDDDWAPH